MVRQRIRKYLWRGIFKDFQQRAAIIVTTTALATVAHRAFGRLVLPPPATGMTQ